MAGIRNYAQIDMRVAPTHDNHLVRLRDMVEYINALTTEGVRAVLTQLFEGTYNAANQTLTGTLNGVSSFVVDNVSVVQGNRILVAGQLDKTQNGIYVVQSVQVNGANLDVVLVRDSDFNDSTNIRHGLIVPILEGDVYGGSRFKTVLGGIPFVMGTTNIEFERIVADTTRVVEGAFILEGDDTTTVYNLTHGWRTRHVTHEMYDADGNTVVGEFARVSVNDVKVTFGIPLGEGNDLTLVLRAEVDPV